MNRREDYSYQKFSDQEMNYVVNIGLDQLARGVSQLSGASLPEYFKLPIEFSLGYHWQVGLDELLFESIDEDLGIDDGGFTYSVGLKW